ncbi:MAG: hypothetical protein NC093_09130 [Alistipes sp.]|nr:hypothetical protein [Alistipes sp.]
METGAGGAAKMIQRVILPGDISTLLAILGVIAVVVYIVTSVARIREVPRERADNSFQRAVGKNRTSPMLAEFYKAAAEGDPDDRDYWAETAEMFSGGDENDCK